MDYGKILTNAWKIVWKHKIFWLLGILASCGNQTGSTSSTNFNYPTTNYQFEEGEFTEVFPEFEHFITRIVHIFERNVEYLWLYGLGIFLVVLLLGFAFFLVRVYGQVGLVQGVMLTKSGEMEEAKKLTFDQIRATVKPYFWRLAGLRLLIFLAGFVIAMLGAGIILVTVTVTLGIGLLCLLPLICVLVPVSWAIMVILKQAEIALIVDDLSVTDAVRRGYDVVRMNLGEYVIMALILLIGGGIVGFLLAIPQLFAVAPISAAFLSSALTEDWTNFLTGLWVSIACLVAYWPVLLVLRGILTSFVESSWVLTFIETSRPDDGTDDIQTTEPELEPA